MLLKKEKTYSPLHIGRVEEEEGLESGRQLSSRLPYLSFSRISSVGWSSKTKFVLLASLILLVCVIAISVSVENYIRSHERSPLEIVLFGDSLISNTNSDYGLCRNLESRLESLHKDRDVVVGCYGAGGRRANDLRMSMNDEVLARPASLLYGWLNSRYVLPPPQAVIIYFDSDASDVDESLYNVDALRRRYIWNLTEVVKAITEKVPYVALGGPTLYGEYMPRGSNPDDRKFDEYCAINRKICKRYNVTYLETRNLFFSNLPQDWSEIEGYLTQDGEHHNAAGAKLIEDLFFDQIQNKWPGLWKL